MRVNKEREYTPAPKDPLFHVMGVTHALRYLSLRAIVILLFPAYAHVGGLTGTPEP